MYGSSLRIETFRPRALNRRPALAAVMPLPREEVTPPVTKTYFAMGQVLRGFSHAIEIGAPGQPDSTSGSGAFRGCRRRRGTERQVVHALHDDLEQEVDLVTAEPAPP